MVYYAFMGIDSDYMLNMFKDLFDDEHYINFSVPYEKYVGNFKGVKKFLYKFFESKKLNKIIRMPFRNQSVKSYIRQYLKNCDDDCEIRFVYCTDGMKKLVEYGIYDYLKKHYKKSKHIFWSADVNYFKKYDVAYLKSLTDMVIVFDKDVAEKAGVYSYPLFYCIDKKRDKKEYKNYDLLFIGQAKTRYVFLIELYRYLSEKGVFCGFFVCGVPEHMQMYVGEEFHYVRYTLSHEEYIDRTLSANCILEIPDPNYNQIGLRVIESVGYNKKILTNNKKIKREAFYNEKYISVFDSIDEIDLDFIANRDPVDYGCGEMIHPKNFIRFIEDNL